MHDEIHEALTEKNKQFLQRAHVALRRLFDDARQKNHLQFCLALNAEFRGIQAEGWNTVVESFTAAEEYIAFLQSKASRSMKARISLALYCHLAEGSGFYEIPKNMLRIVSGLSHSTIPFQELVETHKISGDKMCPNAGKVMKHLVGHAMEAGYPDVAEVFANVFDSELRNAFSHADYVIWEDGVRLPKKNGGWAKIYPWSEFGPCIDLAINFYRMLRDIVNEYMMSYDPPQEFEGAFHNSPMQHCRVSLNRETGGFRIESGITPSVKPTDGMADALRYSSIPRQ